MTGYTAREAFERLKATEPFHRFLAELESFGETNRLTK